jgi:WD40 repeat protein
MRQVKLEGALMRSSVKASGSSVERKVCSPASRSTASPQGTHRVSRWLRWAVHPRGVNVAAAPGPLLWWPRRLPSSAKWVSDGKLIATSSADSTVRIQSGSSGTTLQMLSSHSRSIASLACVMGCGWRHHRQKAAVQRLGTRSYGPCPVCGHIG